MDLLKLRSFLALIAFVALTVACGGSNSLAAPTPVALTNYTGFYQGTYSVTSCSQTGTLALINACSSFSGALPFHLNLNQAGTAPGSIVNSSFSFGSIGFTGVQTTITSNSLTLTGSTLYQNIINLSAIWNLTSPVVGTVNQTWTDTSGSGTMNFTGLIGPVTKTGSAGDVQLTVPHSLPELVRGMTGR